MDRYYVRMDQPAAAPFEPNWWFIGCLLVYSVPAVVTAGCFALEVGVSSRTHQGLGRFFWLWCVLVGLAWPFLVLAIVYPPFGILVDKFLHKARKRDGDDMTVF